MELFRFSDEVKSAVSEGRPVIALESNVLAHGRCYPDNFQCAIDMERAIREEGAVPATIAIEEGCILVGIEESALHRFCDSGAAKVGNRDLAPTLASRRRGVTSASATMLAAEKAGLKFISCPGIGGVHRDGARSMDISADLIQLTQSKLSVVSAGAKNILDLALTLEYLETHGVPVIGVGTEDFPAFYCRSSGLKNSSHVRTPDDCADVIRIHEALDRPVSLLFTAPIQGDHALNESLFEESLASALATAAEQGIRGNLLTPFLIREIDRLTLGFSSKANSSVLISNARLTARIAKAYMEKTRE